MLGRFTVRPEDGEAGTFGVWDGAVNGWRAPSLPNEDRARWEATELDLQFNAHGPRPAEDRWTVEPVRRVEWAQWHTGELDAWIRDNGQILGRVLNPATGTVLWVAAKDLRPLDGSP